MASIHFPPLTKEKAGLLGLFSGAALAALLIQPMRLLPGSPAACALAAGVYAALMLAGFRIGKKLWTGVDAAAPRETADACPKVLDTSVIIDGRVLEISRTGFLEGDLIVPSFVLDELRHIADSADALRRARGRRGLDMLRKMQEELGSALRVEDVGQDAADAEVDVRLLRLAMDLGGAVMTNDYNLNKVAGVAGVPVLNVNDLAGALRPAVLPGEEMTVRIVREGKEPGQGVAYLDDGTMVVVENGRRHVGETLDAEVTTVLQTSAGRMIFGRVKMNENRAG